MMIITTKSGHKFKCIKVRVTIKGTINKAISDNLNVIWAC